MAETPDASSLSRMQRWRIHRHQRRASEREVAERDLRTVAVLSRRTQGPPLSHVMARRVGVLDVTDVEFLDGCRVRLIFCHKATVARLIECTQNGFVTLQRVARHSGFWGLYFQTSTGVLPVLAGDARISGPEGGQRVGSSPGSTPPVGGGWLAMAETWSH